MAKSEKFGSIFREVNEAFRESGYIEIQSDKSKREETAEAKATLRAEGQKCDRHSIMSKVGIHQDKTLDAYKSVARSFFDYCRSHDLGRNHYQYTAEDVRDFLNDRFESGKAYDTLMKDCSALNKLDDILNDAQIAKYGDYKYGKQDFSQVIAEFRKEIKAEFEDNIHINRAYHDPQKVIDNIESKEGRICATLQLNYGLRVMNASKVCLNANGTLFIVSKAGYTVREFKISAKDFAELKALSCGRNKFTVISYDKYRAELKAACAKAGEEYHGTHAFRYNYCQDRYATLRAEGKSHDEARAVCAKELFHGRLDIVDRYLGKG